VLQQPTKIIMPTGTHQDQDSEQLQLFGSLMPSEDEVAPLVVAASQAITRPSLRLVGSDRGRQSGTLTDRPDDLSMIEARLIGRTRFF